MPKAMHSHTTNRDLRQLPYPNIPPTPRAYQTRTPPLSVDDRQASTSWSPDSDEVLLRARQQGLNWQPIANEYFPGKTANACRKRYERLVEKRNAADSWDGAKINHLAKAYIEVREQMWSMLADRIGEKWQTIEAKVCLPKHQLLFLCSLLSQCMEKGIKSLQTAARSEMRLERRGTLQVGGDDGFHRAMNIHRSRSHSRDSDAFHGPDLTTSPFASSRVGHEDEFHGHYPSSAHTSSSSRLPTPNRTFSGSTCSFPPFTPLTATTSPSFPFTTSPTATTSQPPIVMSQPHHQRDPSQTLPSLRDLTLPSLLASSIARHQSPNVSASMQAPVTTH